MMGIFKINKKNNLPALSNLTGTIICSPFKEHSNLHGSHYKWLSTQVEDMESNYHNYYLNIENDNYLDDDKDYRIKFTQDQINYVFTETLRDLIANICFLEVDDNIVSELGLENFSFFSSLDHNDFIIKTKITKDYTDVNPERNDNHADIYLFYQEKMINKRSIYFDWGIGDLMAAPLDHHEYAISPDSIMERINDDTDRYPNLLVTSLLIEALTNT